MVAGLSGLGKTTMCAALLESWQENTNEDTNKETINYKHQKKKKKKPSTTTTTMDIDASRQFERYDPKANTILRVRIIDTPGFGNRVNHRNSVKPITNFLAKCRDRKYSKEMLSPSIQEDYVEQHNSSGEDDSSYLVHVCLYFLSPGRFLEMDTHFLRKVQKEVTIVPIIAKADTLTDEEIARYRAELKDIFEREQIQVYNFDDKTTTTTTTTSSKQPVSFHRGRRRGETLAIISRDGIYPWGHSRSFDPDHSDLKLIRDLLLSEHTERFLERALAKYTKYRARRIARRKIADAIKYVALVGLIVVQIIGTNNNLHKITTTAGTTTTRISNLLKRFDGILVLLPITTKKTKTTSEEQTIITESNNNDPASVGDETVLEVDREEEETKADVVPTRLRNSDDRHLLGLFGTPTYDSILCHKQQYNTQNHRRYVYLGLFGTPNYDDCLSHSQSR
jgi:septin family protein